MSAYRRAIKKMLYRFVIIIGLTIHIRFVLSELPRHRTNSNTMKPAGNVLLLLGECFFFFNVGSFSAVISKCYSTTSLCSDIALSH